MQCLSVMLRPSKIQIMHCLNKLNRYAKKLGLEIEYHDTFAYLPQESIIILDSNLKYSLKEVIYYLHELGHAIQTDSYFHKLKSKSLDTKRSIILEQEYTAWVNGISIARELHILDVIHEAYIREWVSAWSEYASWLHKADSKQVNKLYDSYKAEGRPPVG